MYTTSPTPPLRLQMSSTNPTTTAACSAPPTTAACGAPPTTLTGSTTTTTVTTTTTTTATCPTHRSISRSVTNLGLGYAIAIALGFFVVLLSTVLLASYLYCRASRRRRSCHSRNPNPDSGSDGIMVSHKFFAAGLDQTVINSYPKFPPVKSCDLGNADTMFTMCSEP
ncbi:RING-H2 finger protein ATL68-like [Malania oleifera]|uniref:RING-H2 finger protein ATL68-like n=1 Tax=Malania oleifera TaxID=397392 RepID=UPI0025ADC4F3|nr:RING-H2 finger protein ATL68-like [Malania oleifera]